MAAQGFKWIRPEVYPLFACIGAATGLCAFSLVRKVVGDPGISFSKEVRSHGLADDVKQGQRYKLNYVRKAVQGREPEIMPAVNRWFSGTKFQRACAPLPISACVTTRSFPRTTASSQILPQPLPSHPSRKPQSTTILSASRSVRWTFPEPKPWQMQVSPSSGQVPVRKKS